MTIISDLTCYLVGGAVRDQLLNVENADQDWVVVGSTPEQMVSLGFRPIGQEFPVYLHPNTLEQYALARTERKTGKGYKGFTVDTSENVTLEQDLYRRDLTINAMALDNKGRLIDPYGGQKDLENGLLKHVSTHFVEDPLRVVRVAKFAARYFSRGFVVDDSTMQLMRNLSDSGELDHLVPERVWNEVQSVLAEQTPAVFFKTLHACGALAKLFPQIAQSCDVKVDNCSVFTNLDFACTLTDDVVSRFSVLCYYTGQTVVRQSTTSERNTITIAIDTVEKLCKRLKIPAQYRNTAVQTVRFFDRVRRIDQVDAEHIVDMILALRGLQDVTFFRKFTETCTVLLSVELRDENRSQRQITLLLECRKSMQKTDAKTLALTNNGCELKAKIRDAHIEQVAVVLDQFKTATQPE